jgi:osmotically-inducible protein OsmY
VNRQQEGSDVRLEDQALIDVVRRHLQEDKRLAGQCVDIESSERCIVLVGSVETDEQKRLAEELVEGVVGVRCVENNIEVRSRQTC